MLNKNLNKMSKAVDYNGNVYFQPGINEDLNSIYGTKTRLSEFKTNQNLNSNSTDQYNIDYNESKTNAYKHRNKGVYPVNVRVNINHNYHNSNINIVNPEYGKKVFTNMLTYILDNEDYNREIENLLSNKKNYLTARNSSKSNPIKVLYIPCTNCNNLINADELDSHSDICTKVKEDVIKIDSDPFSCKSVDFKLNKLLENVNNMKNTKAMAKDLHTLSLLSEYMTKALEMVQINHVTIINLKNLITNIDSLILSHKGVINTLILMERSKTLIIEKFNIVKEDIRKKKETEKSNKRKSGFLSKSSMRKSVGSERSDSRKVLEEIRKEIEDETLKKEKIELERDNLIRKVLALKKMNPTSNENTYEDYYKTTLNKAPLIRIEDITSDIETIRSGKMSEKTFTTQSYNTNELDSAIDNNGTSHSNITRVNNDSQLTEDLINTQSQKSVKKKAFSYTYRDFAKIMLKIKFEKLNNLHRGQSTSEKDVWNEVKRQNVPYKDWSDFIFKELNNIEKYEPNNKRSQVKHYKGKMETIHEEVIQRNLV